MAKVKSGGYPQSAAMALGSPTDMAVYLVLIPQLGWFLVLIAARLTSVFYTVGALLLLLFGLWACAWLWLGEGSVKPEQLRREDPNDLPATFRLRSTRVSALCDRVALGERRGQS